MPSFSKLSLERLAQCDARWADIFQEVIKHFDCTILCGHRNEADQNAAYEAGNSKLRWPKSKHNTLPSKAIDVAPYPIDWNDTRRFYYFAGLVMGIAKSKGYTVRWGGDWDKDTQVKDNKFNDLVHFEFED